MLYVAPARLAQSGRLAIASVLRHRRRTAIILIAVAFSVIALILSGAFIDWIFWATRQGAIQSGLGHIQVERQGFRENGSADLDRYLLPPDSPVLDEIRSMPEVKTVAPRLSFSGLSSFGEATVSFLGEGVDPDRERDFTDISIIVQGEELSSAAPSGIIMGRGLAANLGVTVGDKVALLARSGNGGINGVDATIRGLFATVSKAYDDSAIRVPLPLANTLLRRPGTHQWIVVLHDTDRTPGMLHRLQQRYANANLEFVPWYDLADFYKKTVVLLSSQMRVVEIIIALIILLLIGNSMVTSVIERTTEIGTTMAMGTRANAVLFQFVAEGLLLGLAGGLLGALLGILFASIIASVGIPMPPPPGQTRGFRAGMILSVPLVANAFAIAAFTAMLAAVYPAWKASRTIIVDALRHNR